MYPTFALSKKEEPDKGPSDVCMLCYKPFLQPDTLLFCIDQVDTKEPHRDPGRKLVGQHLIVITKQMKNTKEGGKSWPYKVRYFKGRIVYIATVDMGRY